MRILGVDPGLTRCGMGIIDSPGARAVVYVDVRVVRSPADMPPHERLLRIAEGIDDAIETHKPHVMAVERVFAQSNVRSVTGTAQVAGVAMLAAARHGLELALHTPSEVKAAVSGDGRAEKAVVQRMVQRILGLPALPKPYDAADSLALAITHAWRGGAISLSQTDRAQHGGAGMLPRDTGADLTQAQKAWAHAERMSRRKGAVAPKN